MLPTGHYGKWYFFVMSQKKWPLLNCLCFDLKIKVNDDVLGISLEQSHFKHLSTEFSCGQLFVTPCIAPCRALLFITSSLSLPKLVHWVDDAIQPSHPLLSSSPPNLNLSQHQDLFKLVSSSHQVAKVLKFQLQHQFFQWIFRSDLL